MQPNDFRPAERVNRGLVSAMEQRVWMAIARHLPEAVQSDVDHVLDACGSVRLI